MILQRKRLCTALVLIAIITRAVPVLLALAIHGDAHVSSEGDAYQYLELASSLAWSGAFERHGLPDILRTPAYPLLLVPGTWLGAPVFTAVVLQILLGAVVTLLVFEITATVTGSARAATLAAVIYLLEPGQPILAIAVMADALLVALVGMLTWLVVRYEPGTPLAHRHVVMMAAVVTAAAYAKPPAYFLGPALAVALVTGWWMKSDRRTLVSHALGLLLVNALLLAPWHLRNWLVSGYAGFSTQIERAAFVSAPAALISAETGETYAQVRARLSTPPLGGEAGARTTRSYRAWGMPVLLGAVPQYAWIHVKGSALTFFAPPIYVWNYILKNPMEPTRVGHGFLTGGFRGALRELRASPRQSTLLVTLFCLWSLSAVILAGAAVWRRRDDARLRVLAMLVVLWLLIVGGPNRESRHRAPLVPALCTLAALGLAELSNAYRSRRSLAPPVSAASSRRRPS